MKHAQIVVFVLFLTHSLTGQNLKIARLKYQGGGDWYANKTALPNLLRFCKDQLNINFNQEEDIVEPSGKELFNYPYVYLTGHGNIIFSNQEAENIRKYLISGGFLHIDDNYGLDPFIRPELQKIFPGAELAELPPEHPIYNQKFKFPKGLPKIHEHDGKPAQGYGIFYEGRLVIFYSYECDLGNGWEDQRVHNDPESKRLEALRMGANLISFVFLNP
ncbi:MAG: DUF4159 domain-containing protein [Cyclobacteriaceae bacterium]